MVKITSMTNDRITDDDDDDKSDDRWQCVTLGGCSLEWFTEQRMHTISETCFDMMIRMKRNFQQWEPCNMINFSPYITTSEVQWCDKLISNVSAVAAIQRIWRVQHLKSGE